MENDYNSLPGDTVRKCIALAECVISLHKNQFTPFSLSLALQLHHEYGSKNLIETSQSHGFCASYPKLRQFLTSSANHEIIRSQNGTYIPSGICPKISGGGYIQEGSDNVDINA